MTDAALARHDLTIPESCDTVRTLLSRYLARQYRDLLQLRVRGGGAEEQALAILQRHCRDLAAQRPGPLFSTLRNTTVGGMLRFLAGAAGSSPRAPEWSRELAALLYAELALAGAPPPPILLTPPPLHIIVASAGTAIELPADTVTLRLHPDGLTYVTAAGPTTHGWDAIATSRTPLSRGALVPIVGNVSLALADDSPLADYETHPDKEGNRLDLGGVPVEQWVDAMRAALELVRVGVPVVADEIDLLIQQLVPVGCDAEKHLSASYLELVGTIYLTLHPDPLTLAEALIHEHSHNKINMLWTMAPVLDDAFTPSVASPFRPDLRPLHGILLGVHAFLPVEKLYEQLALADHPAAHGPSFDQRRKLVRERNAEACEILSRQAHPTESGRPVVEEIMRWNAHFA